MWYMWRNTSSFPVTFSSLLLIYCSAVSILALKWYLSSIECSVVFGFMSQNLWLQFSASSKQHLWRIHLIWSQWHASMAVFWIMGASIKVRALANHQQVNIMWLKSENCLNPNNYFPGCFLLQQDGSSSHNHLDIRISGWAAVQKLYRTQGTDILATKISRPVTAQLLLVGFHQRLLLHPTDTTLHFWRNFSIT